MSGDPAVKVKSNAEEKTKLKWINIFLQQIILKRTACFHKISSFKIFLLLQGFMAYWIPQSDGFLMFI